jgi:hypothetical protein
MLKDSKHFTAAWRPFPLLHTKVQYLKDNSSLLCVAYQLSRLAMYGTLLHFFDLYNMCLYIYGFYNSNASGKGPSNTRPVEGSAKCRHLKKLTCKGTLRQVFICLRPRTPYPHPLHNAHCCIHVYSIRIHTRIGDCISSL